MSSEIQVTVDVVRHEEEYLIVRRSAETEHSGYWEFVGGKVEKGETVTEAALRELYEEAGLEGEIEKLGEKYTSRSNSDILLAPVLIEAYSRDVSLSREHDDYDWIDLEDLDRYQTLGEHRSLDKLEL